ncbi:hypothetical protein CSPX01_11030, partial [Colletotrichum filicis]
ASPSTCCISPASSSLLTTLHCGHSQSGHLLLLSTHFPPNPDLSRLVLSLVSCLRRQRERDTGRDRRSCEALGLSPLPYLPYLTLP